MRITQSFVAALAIVFVASTTASAQIGRGIGRRAASAIERKVDQKIDQKIEEAAEKLVNQSFNSIFGDDGTSSSSSGDKKSSGGSRIFSVLPNAPTEARYDFDVVLTYELEKITKSGKSEDKVLMLMHFNKDGNYAGTRLMPAERKKSDGEVFAIFDVKNESMVMLMESEDGKFSIAYGWKDAVRYAEKSASQPPPATTAGSSTSSAPVTSTATYSHIGSRTIAGVPAEGYRSETADGTMDVWVAKDASLDHSRMMGASSSMKQLRTMPTSHPEGMLLEITATDRNGEKSKMTATKIDRNAKVRIDMDDYPRVGKAAAK